jgi:fucose permease
MAVAMTTKRQMQIGLIPLLICYAGFIVLGMPDGLLGMAWPSMQGTFSVSLDAMGILLLPGTIAYMLASTLSGRLIGSHGIGWFLLVGAAVRALGFLGVALAPSWGLLLAVLFVAGLGTGVIDSGMNTFVATNYSAGRLSWLHACFGLGATFTPLIMTAILESNGPWQGGYALVAVFQLVIAGLIAFTFSRWHINTPLDESNGQPTKAAPARATLLIPAVLLGILTFFMYTGVEVTGGNWTFTLFTEARHIPTVVAGPWISLYWGSLTAGRVLSGLVVDRLGEMRILRWSLLGIVLGALLISVPAEATSMAGIALLGLAEAAIFPTLIAITPARFGAEHAPNAIGFQIAAAGLGVTILPGLAGVLARAIGLEVIGPFMVVAAVIMFGLFEFGIRLAPPRNGKKPAGA